MLGSIWAVGLSCGFAPLPHRDRPADAAKPLLLAKGKGYFVHVMPLPRFQGRSWVWPEDSGIPGMTRTAPTGSAVLHTSTATGEMKVLAYGASTVTHGPPMGIDRIFYNQTRVVGVVADAERIAVLEWQLASESMPKAVTEGQTGRYHLLVFRPADGALVQDLTLKEGQFPKDPPVESLDAGPLVVRGDSVSCFGVTFTFKGTQLVRQQYEKKP